MAPNDARLLLAARMARARLSGRPSLRAILLAKASALKGDAARAHSDFISGGGEVIEVETETALNDAIRDSAGIVIDGIFGTGLNAEVKGLLKFNAGVNAHIDRVRLLIQGVEARVLLEARLGNLVKIVASKAQRLAVGR